jgi:hypothetical protein
VHPHELTRVVLGINLFIVDVGEVTAQPCDLLRQPGFCVRHELPIALIPQLVTVRDRPGDGAAIGLDGVVSYQFGCVSHRDVSRTYDYERPVCESLTARYVDTPSSTGAVATPGK